MPLESSFFEEILDKVPAEILVADAEYRFLYANPLHLAAYQVRKTFALVCPNFFHHLPFFLPPSQVKQASAMKGNQGLFRIVIQALPDDNKSLSITVSGGIGEIDVGGKGNIPRQALPEKTKFIPLVPNIITSRNDAILFTGFVITG